MRLLLNLHDSIPGWSIMAGSAGCYWNPQALPHIEYQCSSLCSLYPSGHMHPGPSCNVQLHHCLSAHCTQIHLQLLQHPKRLACWGLGPAPAPVDLPPEQQGLGPCSRCSKHGLLTCGHLQVVNTQDQMRSALLDLQKAKVSRRAAQQKRAVTFTAGLALVGVGVGISASGAGAVVGVPLALAGAAVAGVGAVM